MLDLKEIIKNAELGKTYLFSAGQAGFIIKNSQGKTLAIDLYLSNCLEEEEGHIGFKRLQKSILQADEINFDVIIATHPHLDHYDKESMPQLMKGDNSKLFASVFCEQYVVESNIPARKVKYVKPGDEYQTDGFVIHFVNCDHGDGAPDAVGVIVETDGKIIYEAGDTCLRLDRVKEYVQFGNPDVMIAPINGAYGNMNEVECAQFSNAIKPKVTIPCHYGMFASHYGSPGLFYEEMKKYDNRKFMFMAQGDMIEL